MSTDQRADSTGSSLLSTTTSVLAEDIIHDFGDAPDYSMKRCECLYNSCYMCCNKNIPDQR